LTVYMILKWDLYTLHNMHGKFRDIQSLNDV
jgi:hypothetical protein